MQDIYENAKNNIGDILVGEDSNFVRNIMHAPENIVNLKTAIFSEKAYSDMVTPDEAKRDGKFKEGVHYHGLGYETLYDALRASEDPVCAFVSLNTKTGKPSLNRVTVVTNVVDKHDNPIIVGFEFDSTGTIGGETKPVNKDVTAFGRERLSNMIKKAYDEGRMLYYNDKKNQKNNRFERVHVPNDVLSSDFNNNIQQFWNNFKNSRQLKEEAQLAKKRETSADNDGLEFNLSSEDGERTDRRIADTGNVDVDAIMNDIFESMSDEEFRNYLNTGEFEYATSEQVEDDPEVQDEGLWVKEPEGDYVKIDDSYTSNGKKVAWKDERIDALIDENEKGDFAFSGHDPYQYHYAIELSPKEYEALSYIFDPRQNEVWRNDVATQPENYGNGEVDFGRLGGTNNSTDPYRYRRKNGYMFFDASYEGGALKIKGQEGNHRALILGNSGYESMPVILGSDTELRGPIQLKGMNAGDIKNPNVKFFSSGDYIELKSENRDRLIQKFGSGANSALQYSVGETSSGNNVSVSTSGGDGDTVRPTAEVVDGYGEQRNQRFATSNIPKTPFFSEEQQERNRERVANGEFTYMGLINKVEVQRAMEYMERDGVDATYDRFMAVNRPDAKSVIQGEVLLQKLATDNDPRWETVASKLADDATYAGQFLQAYAIMQRLTPSGQLATIRRNMDRMQKYLDNRFGNKAPRLEIGTELEQELMNAKTAEEQEEVRDKIQKHLTDQVPKTFRSMINSWRYLAMLGNPRTHIRNFIGNAINIPAVTLKNAIGTVLESAMGNKLEYRTKAVLNRSSKVDQARLELGGKAYDEYRNAIEKAQGQKYENEGFSDKTAIGRVLNKLSDWNSEALDAEDRLFSRARYASSFAQFLKANNLTAENLTPEMEKRANEYALLESERATYRDANAVADWLNELSRSDKKGLRMASYVKDAIMPFTKTPMNIVKRGVRYSPVGLLYTVTNDAKQLADGKINANQFIDNLAQGLTGTGIALMGALLRSLGLFRTKDDDKDRKQYFDSENGEQDYAIDLSIFGLNGTYTVDWASPVIMPFAIGSELYDVFKNMEGVNGFDGAINAVADVSAKVMDPIMETSMLSSLQDALKSYSTSGGEWLGEMVTSMASSYIQQMFPTIGGQIARTIDDTRRTTYTDKGKIDKTIKQIMNKIPWLSK